MLPSSANAARTAASSSVHIPTTFGISQAALIWGGGEFNNMGRHLQHEQSANRPN